MSPCDILPEAIAEYKAHTTETDVFALPVMGVCFSSMVNDAPVYGASFSSMYTRGSHRKVERGICVTGGFNH